MILFILLIAGGLPARAEEFLEDLNPRTFNKLHKLDKDNYDDYKVGDRYEWTLYQQRYDKPDYGHVYEWTKPGLSMMSLCVELDPETGGQRYHQLADDLHCPQYDTEYKWDVPFQGLPSRCLSVDSATKGQRYARVVDNHRCEKPFTVFLWEKKAESMPAECFELDDSTQGLVYRKSAAPYLCARSLDVVVAYGRKNPNVPRPLPSAARAPASVALPIELDPQYRESPEDLEDGVDHVHRSADKIHHR